jgi:hypothetical protein
MHEGMVTALENAPTELGPVSFRAEAGLASIELDIDFRPRESDAALVLHLPPFLQDVKLRVDSGHVAPAAGGWLIPASARRVRAWWRDEPLPGLSYEAVAQAYTDDYRRRMKL